MTADSMVELTKDGFPAVFTVGGRIYRIHSFMEDGDGTYVDCNIMRKRGVKLGAAMTQEDGKHILKHKDEIPKEYRGKIRLVFTDWRREDGSCGVTCLWSGGGLWVPNFYGVVSGKFDADDRLVSRVA